MTDKDHGLPLRSQCKCPCHYAGMMHIAPCCQPDKDHTMTENVTAVVEAAIRVFAGNGILADDRIVLRLRSTILTALTDAGMQVVPTSGEPVAWIVGNGAGTCWRMWKLGNPVWTNDRTKATRYARREDAEAVHAEDEDAWSVTPYSGALAAPTVRVEADAARYRWLRDQSCPPHNFYISVPDEFHGVRYSPTDVDAYIDAALAAFRSTKGDDAGQ